MPLADRAPQRAFAPPAVPGRSERGHRGWRVTIVSAASEQVGFAVQPRRWVVERTFGWLGRYRRLAKDFETLVECVVAHILLASLHVMLKRLEPAPA